MNYRTLIVCCTFGFLSFTALAEESSPVSPKELQSVQELYQKAQQQETEALASFREIRALQSSRALQIPLEEARKRLQIPAPERTPIDLSVLQLTRPDPARVVEQRRILVAVNTRVDEILTFVRQLKEQLKEEEIEAETMTMEALRAELELRSASDKLAAEDPGEPSKDMTEAALAGDPAPAEEAVVDAAVANQAATEAEAMAKEAEAKQEKFAPEAKKVASEAREAAEAALKAATEANNASDQKDKVTETAKAAEASSEAANAVAAAVKVAQITGNLSFVAAEKEHSAKAAASKGGSKVTSSQLGGFTPGATKFLPGKAKASRRIGALGQGIEWIYIDSWYMLGPFPNPNRRNVDTSYPPESVIDLDAAYVGEKGADLRWQFVQSPNPCVIPDSPGEYVIYYAYSELWCDQDMDLWVMAGSDDSSRIWVNDQQIWKSGYGLKPWRLNEGLRKVSFRRGINRILYRIENGWGLFGFSFAINLSPVQTAQAPATSGSTTR